MHHYVEISTRVFVLFCCCMFVMPPIVRTEHLYFCFCFLLWKGRTEREDGKVPKRVPKRCLPRVFGWWVALEGLWILFTKTFFNLEKRSLESASLFQADFWAWLESNSCHTFLKNNMLNKQNSKHRPCSLEHIAISFDGLIATLQK